MDLQTIETVLRENYNQYVYDIENNGGEPYNFREWLEIEEQNDPTFEDWLKPHTIKELHKWLF